MSRPEVTVLMPVRDGARYLDAAIGSILRQTLRNFEFLICDDGSTDATPAILARWAAEDSRIRVIAAPWRGIAAVLNVGFQQAAADWVARMDADDIAAPERLCRQLAAAAAHPEAAAIGTAWRVMDAAGRVRALITPPVEPDAIAAALLRHNCLAHPTMLLRRQAVLQAGGYRAAFRSAEDYDLWLRLSEHHPLRALPEPLLDYREHAGQTAWVALEHRILAELGAQAASRARRAGLPDPTADAAVIDRPLLRRAGLGETEITAFTISRALGAAQHALGAGQGRAARAALRLLWAQPGLKPRTRAHAVLLLARSLLVSAAPPA